MPAIRHIETGAVSGVSSAPQWVSGVWECGDKRFTDPTGTEYSAVAEFPKVGPIAFQMLFTPQEAMAADGLKATDPVLASFWKLIDDPRTDVVDLGLQSVQNAIEYTLTAVKNSRVDVDVPVRKAAILSGALQ